MMASVAPDPDGLPSRQRALAFLAIAIALTIAVLDGAIVNVALPAMARDLAATPNDVIWVTNAYQLAVTVSLLPLAALGDIHGYRKVYLGGLAVFTAASFLCAVSSALPLLIAARALQGLGAAGIMSVNIALVRFIFPRDMIGRGVGYTAMVVAVASAAGPTIGALVLSAASWPWLFLVNVPLGLLAMAVGRRTLPGSPKSGAPFDVPSAFLNALTFGLLILGIDALSRADQPAVPVLLLSGSAIAGVVFARRQVSVPRPMLPIDLLRIPVFALSMATSICSFSAQMLAYVSFPFWLQDVLGLSVGTTGLLMTPWPVATALTSPIAGRLADHHSPARLGGIGLVILAAGFVLLATLPAAPASLDIAWRLFVCGIGFGLFQSPNNKAIITSAPRDRSGGASGLQSTARLVGQGAGTAVAAVIFALAGPAAQLGIALWISTALALGGALASLLRRFDGPPRP